MSDIKTSAGTAARPAASVSAPPSAASTSVAIPTGTPSVTKPKGTSSQKDLDHKAAALLVASVLKKLAVLHERQLLKGSAGKIPAKALKSIRQLNEMLDNLTLEEDSANVCLLLA